MAHVKHEHTLVYAKGEKDGFTTVPIGGDPLQAAQKLVSDGYQNVRVVTERVTWRGANGKRKYETISETPVE